MPTITGTPTDRLRSTKPNSSPKHRSDVHQLRNSGYTNGSYPSAFHDITTGNNSFAGITGYSAATGWDAATGLGTPDATKLVTALASTTP